jgi:hypothetical protein
MIPMFMAGSPCDQLAGLLVAWASAKDQTTSASASGVSKGDLDAPAYLGFPSGR